MGVIGHSVAPTTETAVRDLAAGPPHMRAVVQHRYGGPDVLVPAVVDVPDLGDHDVLVRVRAASIGAWVDHSVAGDPLVMRLQFGLRSPRRRIRASDIAGDIVAVGSKVGRFRPGDQVYGEADAAFAELAAIDAGSLVSMPHNVTYAEAATIPIAGQTALLGLRNHGHLQRGQHVLIIGAAGGVGSFAVQIAKARGAEVTAMCSTTGVELVRTLGADHVIDYTRRGATAGDRRYDVVFQLGGAYRVAELRRLLTPRGTLVLSSGEGGRWVGPIGRLLWAMALSLFVRQHLRTYVTSSNVADLAALTALVERGDVTPVVDRTYPLDRMADALRHFRQPHGWGKTVVTIGSSEGDSTR